ncbi:hypothetical protein Tco_1238266 [Tanacetum coccineum]
MDLVIPLGQKNTLAEYMILSEHGIMILESVENGPLIWPTVEENGVTRTKKYAELSAAEKIQADCDMKATNIILQGLPADIYSLDAELQSNKYIGDKVKVILVLGIRVMLLALGETMQADRKDLGVPEGQAVQTIIPNNTAFQTEDLDTYGYDCDDISNAQVVLMANISNYGSDVISEVPHSKTYLNDMVNQGMQAMQDFKQPPAVDFTDNEIHSDSNIIPYSQYLQETQQENVQDTHLQDNKIQ